ncbi:hypothetical protein HXX76_012057 [Chlamydomonas incerta]|uniref:Uncharacterized protein n=1 Tax=Chlamydomonas incerta TaxID=51695 RepID=A0A835SID6_CHLIN|nr:hypothetical protein HXX76_012057 [Chlamydomonas incerta]|eukprot:KAG2427732.1 hypothetical protein HXX76_012057 [Chlamydomonas incerta]
MLPATSSALSSIASSISISNGLLPYGPAGASGSWVQAGSAAATGSSAEAGSNALLGQWPSGETPLLVPLVGGAATNMSLDESYGAAQEALIARYLLLLGAGQQQQQPLGPGAGAGGGASLLVDAKDTAKGANLHLDLSSLPPRGPSPTGPQPGSNANSAADGQSPSPASPSPAAASAAAAAPLLLRSLGLDQATLAARHMPEALVGALHRSLAASAAAFFRTCLAERRKLAALMAGGEAVPLADRVLAFITGTEGELQAASALPDMQELREAGDVELLLNSVTPPGAAPYRHAHLHHELEWERAQPPPSPPPPPAEPEPDLEALMDIDKITALAAAGNVPGMRALLRGLVGALAYSRNNLSERLAAEAARAQREWQRGEATRTSCLQLREQLAGRNRVLAERDAQLQAAVVRAAAAAEELVAERGAAAGLRAQLRALQADSEQQLTGLKTGLEAQIADLKQALHGAMDDGSGPGGAGGLGSQLAAARSELALADLRQAQERAVSGQLRVMLDSARGQLATHRDRAATAGAEVERLTRLVAAAQDLANATSGGLGLLEQQLGAEKAAHRRTTERLQAVNWRLEGARCAVVDMRSRAAAALRRLQTVLGDTTLRAAAAERQAADREWELRAARRELEELGATAQALKERNGRLEIEAAAARQEAIAAKLDGDEAEARVAALQEQVVEGAEATLAGKAASARLVELEKEHGELQSSFASLSAAHQSLSAAHAALTGELGAMRERLTELERRDALLVDLTARHDALLAEHSSLKALAEELTKELTSSKAAYVVLKKHADALAGQVQEYRYKSDRAAADLEQEREGHRSTRAELDITSAQREDLSARCDALMKRVDEMEKHVATADAEAARCRRAAELAEQQRAEAFALRDAWTRVRLLVSSDVREYLSAISGQLGSLEALLGSSRADLTALQARLLDLPPGALDGSGLAAPQVPFEMAQRVCDSLFRMVSCGGQLLQTQAEIRTTLLERLDHVEDGLQERLRSATDYWRQVLALSRGSPRAMVQVVERMTGQVCRELELDPSNPLARMVPIGVLEEAGVELSTQHERLGGLRGSAHAAEGAREAAVKLLDYEREVSTARAAEYQSLVEALSGEVGRLRARVSALEANNSMQQKATADMQRMLTDAEWKVSKAQEREALLGVKYLVPLGRESRAVQTVFSDLHHHHMVAHVAGPGLGGLMPLAGPGSLSGEAQAQVEAAAAAAARGRSRSRAASPLPNGPSRPLSAATTVASQGARSRSGSPSRRAGSRQRARSRHATSGAGLSEPGEAMSAAEETEGGEWDVSEVRVTGSGESEAGAVGGAAVRALETAFAGAAAAAAAAASSATSTPASTPARPSLPLHMLSSAGAGPGAPSPDSPASLPPLTALNSPASTLAPSALSPRLPSTAGGSGAAVSFATPHRQPHPNAPPQPQRPASAMVAPLSGLAEARRAANLGSRSNPNSPRGTGGLAAGGPGGPSRLGGANAMAGAAAAQQLQQVQQQLSRLPQAHPQRRRHPDQVPRGSGGGGGSGAVGSWAALPTVKSTASYGDEEDEVDEERAGSEVYGGSNAAGEEDDDEEAGYEDEGEGEPGEYDLPPAALRTPSASATAAAAAAFAARGPPVLGDAGLEGVWQAPAQPQRSAASASAGAGPDSPLSPLRQYQHQQRPYTAAPGGSGGLHSHPPSPAPARATASLGGTVAFASPPGSPLPQHHRSAGGGGGPTPPAPAPTTTASGIPHGWQQRAWDWVPEAAALAARGGPGGGPLQPYSRQALLELLADIHFTKAHADQVAAAAAFPQVSMQQYVGAYFAARHGPRGGNPPATEMALAQLLLSLEAHSALYEVMLFTRLAKLEATTSKPSPQHRNSLRPATATTRSFTASPAGSGPSSPASAASRMRPGSSRPGLNTSAAAAAAIYGGGGSGGGGMTSPRSPAAGGGAAAARSSRLMSAHSNAPHAGQRGNHLLAHAQAAAGAGGPGADEGAAGPGPGPGGETTMRLRTGASPAVASSNTHSNGGYAQQQQQQQLATAMPVPRLRLGSQRQRLAEVLVPEGLGRALAELRGVAGMEPFAAFAAAGRLLGRLRQSDLGAPLREEQHPELHYLVAGAASAMGLDEPPELVMAGGELPYGQDVMLLQLPNVALDALSYLADDVDRPPPAGGIGPGGWRRRAVLLLSPAVVEAAAAAAPPGERHGSGDGSHGQPYGATATSPAAAELAALLGGALAPMLMPGGGGWRLELQGGGPVGPQGVPPPASAASRPLLSAAEVVTAVNVAALKPRAALAALPSQLQVKWERLLAHLRAVAGLVAAAADRGALLAVQQLAPAVRATYRAAAGLSLAADAGSGAGGVLLGSGEDLLLQAQAAPWSGDTELHSRAAQPAHEIAAGAAAAAAAAGGQALAQGQGQGGAQERRRHALARVALLGRWAESQEYRGTLRAAVMGAGV